MIMLIYKRNIRIILRYTCERIYSNLNITTFVSYDNNSIQNVNWLVKIILLPVRTDSGKSLNFLVTFSSPGKVGIRRGSWKVMEMQLAGVQIFWWSLLIITKQWGILFPSGNLQHIWICYNRYVRCKMTILCTVFSTELIVTVLSVLCCAVLCCRNSDNVDTKHQRAAGEDALSRRCYTSCCCWLHWHVRIF